MGEPKLTIVWAPGRRKLGKDHAFGPWVKRIGTIRLPVSQMTPFCYLVRAICYQQLAGKAALTIHGRVVEALKGDVSPQNALRARESTLRGAGLSGSKYAAIRGLATKIRSGELDVHDLDEQPDDEIIQRLVTVRGIGVWTAQMYLMFGLNRPDVWPVGDLGVRAGYAKVHGLDEYPTAKQLEPLGDIYGPWRSAAAWYCYRVLETELP
jgi:DNA-3-methyladenine glycosylase II